MTKTIQTLVLAHSLCLLVFTAQAEQVTWTIQNARFEDGSFLTGSFDYDASTNTYSSINLTTDPFGDFGVTYPDHPSFVSGSSTNLSLTSLSADDELFLGFAAALTDAGGTLLIQRGLASYEQVLAPAFARRFFDTGSVTASGVQTAPGPFIPGDVNDDGVFDIADPTVLRRDLAGLEPGVSQTCFAEPPATGQMTCWNSIGTIIPCAGTGHDGDVQTGAPLIHQDNGDGTITDLNTGLMWEKKGDNLGIHDQDNLYTWDDAFAVHVATLNSSTFAGHTNWRVPNSKELYSILNLEVSSPSVSRAFNTGCVPTCTVLTCSCTWSVFYWSSSSRDFFPSGAWIVGFQNGTVTSGGKSGSAPVRAVRGP